jgi:uncharacterized BrkB/YihY/UPF0761 family membrane protein
MVVVVDDDVVVAAVVFFLVWMMICNLIVTFAAYNTLSIGAVIH